MSPKHKTKSKKKNKRKIIRPQSSKIEDVLKFKHQNVSRR